MGWQKYTLCFRLLSPMHIGYRKVGNLMQTRGYVPGKILWAALTARLTRDTDNSAVGRRYDAIGNAVDQSFRFGYLYPALPKAVTNTVQSVGDFRIYYPWEDSRFDYRFLGSYAGTALDYEQQASAEGQLREVEFIRPRARALPGEVKASQVYFVGDFYAHAKMDPKLANWREALGRVQLGGERGYGWGRVHLESIMDRGIIDAPVIKVKKGEHALAHVRVGDAGFLGSVEPLIGWERDNTGSSAKNWRLSLATICYAPGATVVEENIYKIGHYGIWEP